MRGSEGSTTLRLVTALRSVTGRHRSSNQDSVGCSDAYAFVADGVGGHAGGDVASWTVTHRLMSALAGVDARRLDTDELRGYVGAANAEIATRVGREPALRGMATTFTGVFCGVGSVRLVHVGDSRAFLVRDGAGRRMTRDDSLVQQLVDDGAVTEAVAEHHPMRNVILRCLSGAAGDVDAATVVEVAAQPGDRWLVASDGLTDYVPEEQLLRLLVEAPDPEAAADALLAAADEADSHDNVSVAVSDVVLGAPDGRPYRVLGAAAARELGLTMDLSR